MLLRVSSIASNPIASTLVVDDFVPAAFRVEGAITSRPLYWHTGDLKRSLVEVGIDPDTRLIRKVTATLLGGLRPRLSAPWTNSAIEVGLPVFELAAFASEAVHKHPNSLLYWLDSSSAWISVDGAPEARACLGQDRIRFLLADSRELVGIGFVQLNNRERHVMRTALEGPHADIGKL